MKKIYFKLLPAVFLLALPGSFVNAQCSLAAPVITANSTLICASSGSFALSATPAPSAVLHWYANSFGGNAVANTTGINTPLLGTGTSTYYAGQVTGATSASIALPAPTATVQTNPRGYFFTAPTSFVITGVRVSTASSNSIPDVAIVKFAATPPLYPSATNSFNVLFYDPQDAVNVTNVISVYIPVNSGDIIGVIGDRNDTSTYYSPQPYSTTLGTYPLTITRLGSNNYMANASPSNLWTEPSGTGNIGLIELYTSIGCVSPLGQVQVVVSNPPSVTASGPSAPICAGDSAIISVAGSGTYTWSNGPSSNSQTLSPASSTYYSVRSSNAYGCLSNKDSAEIVVQPLPNLVIASSSSVICKGNSGTLTVSGASSYAWNTGSNDSVYVISPNQTATYVVTGTDNVGCIGSTTLTLPVSTVPVVTITASKSTICIGESAVLTANGADTYSWNTGATTQTLLITPTGPKTYTAVGTNTAGCTKKSTITINALTCTGIEENTAADNTIKVFPNPSNGQITIQSDEIIRQLTLRDISGRIILDQQFDALTTLSLNLDNLNAGVYFIDFPQAKYNRSIKVIKE